MQAIDTDWCLRCEIKTKDGSAFCSAECHDAHDHQQSSRPSPARTSSPSLASLSSLDLSASYYPPSHYAQDVHSDEWVGRGSNGVSAWAAQIPLGAPPQSVASSYVAPSPIAVRARKSTSSARSVASSSASASAAQPSSSKTQPIASSSTLRPTIPSLSARKLAPPRLFLQSTSPSCNHTCRSHSSSHDSSVCSPHTTSCTVLPHDSCPSPTRQASPTQPILNNRASIPSLTAQSATASLSSLATPHTTSRPPSRPHSRPSSFHPQSRPGSHPASASVSIAGDDDDDEDDESTPESRPPKKTSWYQAAMSKVSTGVKQWAAGERMGGHVPYSTAHIVAVPRTTAPRRDEPEKTPSRAPAAAAPTAPIPRSQTRSARAYVAPSPVSFFPLQDELVRAPPEPEKRPPAAVRRGLTHTHTRGDLQAHFAPRESTVWGSRGRRAERTERTFASVAEDAQ